MGTGYTAVSLQGSALRTQVRQLAPKYADIVINVRGRDTRSLRAALTVAQTVLIPVQPRSFDIWAVDLMAELVKEARELNETLHAFAVLNAADAQGRDNADAGEVLKEAEEIILLPVMVGKGNAFPSAAAAGRAVNEHVPRDLKAVSELQVLLDTLYLTPHLGATCHGDCQETQLESFSRDRNRSGARHGGVYLLSQSSRQAFARQPSKTAGDGALEPCPMRSCR